MPIGQCRLCKCESELQLSHIIPAFVYRWLIKTSATGYIRIGSTINRRSQDGHKLHLLCSDCEERLNKFETPFSQHFFHKYSENTAAKVPYTDWLIKFAVSLSWRVLHYYRDLGGLDDWNTQMVAHADEAEKIWRAMLLSQRPDPGDHTQHLILTGLIAAADDNLTPTINRYLTRATDMHVARNSDSAIVYTKFGKFIFVGTIREPRPNRWKGTRINVHGGTASQRNYVLPREFGNYLNDRAVEAAKSYEGISDTQRAKIEKATLDCADRVVESELFQAMLADVSMFGPDAFWKRNKSDCP